MQDDLVHIHVIMIINMKIFLKRKLYWLREMVEVGSPWVCDLSLQEQLARFTVQDRSSVLLSESQLQLDRGRLAQI